MTSIYAIRLYELLMQWRTTGKREVSIEWLKEQFELEERYSRMYDLKKYVIEPAIKDINTHSNFTVKWEQRKTGRTVTHLIFTFKEKQTEADAATPKKRKSVEAAKNQEELAKANQINELKNLENLNKLAPNPAIKEQIMKLKEALKKR